MSLCVYTVLRRSEPLGSLVVLDLKCSSFCHAFCTCCMQYLNKGWYHNLFTEVGLIDKTFSFLCLFQMTHWSQARGPENLCEENFTATTLIFIFIRVKQSRKIILMSKFSNRIMITSVAQTLQYFGATSIEVSNKRIFDEVETMTYTLSIYQSKHDWSEGYLELSWKFWPVFDVKYLHCSWGTVTSLRNCSSWIQPKCWYARLQQPALPLKEDQPILQMAIDLFKLLDCRLPLLEGFLGQLLLLLAIHLILSR